MRYPTYKPSGQPWLSKIPAHWKLTRLKYAAEINPTKSASAFAAKDQIYVSFLPMEVIGEQGEVNLTRTKRIEDVYNGFTYAEDDDVIVAKITPCFENGKGAHLRELVSGVAFCSTEFHVLRSVDCSDPRFLYYLSYSHAFRLPNEAFMQGSAGQKRVGTREVEEYLFGLPPLPEQRAIARYLDAKTAQIDQLIAAKERLVELLTEQRTALIHRAVTRGLDPDVKLKDSGVEWLGEVPEGWAVVKLRRLLLSIEQGWSPQCEERRALDTEWGVLKVGAVNYGKFNHTQNKYIETVPESKHRYSIRKGDVLMSRANTTELVGSTVYVKRDHNNLLLCDKIYRLEFVKDKALPEWATLWLQSKQARNQIEDLASGASSSMQNISQDKVTDMSIAVPTPQEQTDICEYATEVRNSSDQALHRHEAAISSLRALRTALISEVVTGQRDVRKHPLAQEPAAHELNPSHAPQ